MHLSKRQGQLLAATVLGGFFLIGAILTGAKSQFGSIPKIELQKDAEGNTQARVVIGEFRKSESKDGKKIWEVQASTARYYPDKNIAELENGSVWLYREDDVVEVTSKLATVHLTGSTLLDVKAEGAVVVHSKKRGVFFRTEEATYNKEKESLECPGHVDITAPQGDISGEGLTGDTAAKDFTLKRNVTTVLKAQDKNANSSATVKEKTK